ncbi:MAG: hypothetical protein LBQ73_01780 [Tannerellaceae bacterium]|jgi:hypothetical protein|nr:hypothetical protein [Tannerellaceae bacterium]
MRRITGKTAFILLCLGLFPHLYAQVTIGVAEAPAEGALLQLKNIAAAAGNKNAEKGLLMPRVSLKNDSTLAPMFPDATAGEKKKHAGLIVYNLTEKDPLTKGIMVWDGSSWINLKTKDLDVDPDVKKILYISDKPLGDKSLSVRSINVSMSLAGYMGYEALPRFRVTEPYKPAGSNTKEYLYHITRYWTDENDIPNGEYSTDLNRVSFTQDNYSTPQDLRLGYMTTQEKDEVWLLDDDNDDIFHIQFFELGTNYQGMNRQYAILVERF